MTSVLPAIQILKQNMMGNIIGQEEVIDRLLISLLLNGNLLVEGLPGLAKTRAIKALAKNIDCIYSRIQFTPDLRSTDITGRQTYYSDDNGEHFKFEKGPIFANLVLADEINRAP
ncbi:MAG: AAA family ATPase, partial [Alphaproteobacteria bacterium]|nr:AAA family ATPase [Alphaproteobacteria bacterium]